MTAEERLQALRERQEERLKNINDKFNTHIKLHGLLKADEIDLIADLVVERMASQFTKLDKAHEWIIGEGIVKEEARQEGHNYVHLRKGEYPHEMVYDKFCEKCRKENENDG